MADNDVHESDDDPMATFDEPTVITEAIALQVFDEAVVTDKAANLKAMSLPKTSKAPIVPGALRGFSIAGSGSWMRRDARVRPFASLSPHTTRLKAQRDSTRDAL